MSIPLCWLLIISVRSIRPLRAPSQSFAACRFPRGRGQSECIHLLIFKGGVMYTVHGILTFIKRLPSLCLQSLHHRFIDWTKPDTATSLMGGMLTDLARSKSELVAENALLRHQLIILRRQVKRPACTNADLCCWCCWQGWFGLGNKRSSLSSQRRFFAGIVSSSACSGSINQRYIRESQGSRLRQSP
jgi:hypothetical protein